jgi:hypothetical protein
MPLVKSSHRAEAMARALGFQTNGSLRDALGASTPPEVSVSAFAFKEYLTDRGFAIAGTELHRAVAKAALTGIAEQWPRLTIDGFGVGEYSLNADGTWETSRQYRARFDTSRGELISDFALAPFLASLAFLERIERTKTVRPGTGSRWLKHIAEHYECTYPDGEPLGPTYVANGVLIAAAIHAGFVVKPLKDEYGAELLTAHFNMRKAVLDEMNDRWRPESGRAQDRLRERQRRERRRARGRLADAYLFD